MLRDIQLKNFKRHSSFETTFGDTLNVIKGPNGAGKSTLMQAVMFALYGTKAVPGGKAVIPSVGVGDAHVTLRLDLPAGLAKVDRTLKNASVSIDDKVVASGHEPVTAWVTEQLGMDLKQCRMLSYSEQGETAALFTIGAAALQKSVEEMSGADLIDRVIERAKTKASEFEGRIAGRQLIDLGPLEGEQQAATAAVAEAELTKDAAVEALDTARAAKDTAEAALAAGQDLNKRRAALLDKRTRFEIVLTTQKAERAKIQQELQGMPSVSVHDAGSKRDAASIEWGRLNQVVTVAAGHRQTIATLEAWLKDKAEPGLAEEQRLEPLVAAALARIEASRQALANAIAAKGAADTALAAARKHASDARAGAACATCKRPFEGVNEGHVAGLEQAVGLAQREAEAAGTVVSKARIENSAAEADHAALLEEHPGAGWAALIETETAKLTAARGALAALPEVDAAVLQKAGAEVTATQAAYEAAVRADGVKARLVARLAELETSITDTQAAFDAVGEIWAEQDLEPLRAARNEAESKVNYAIEAQGHANLQVQLRREKLQGTVLACDRARDNNRIIEGDSKQLARHHSLIKFLRDNRTKFLEQTWANIMASVSEFVNQATAGRITEIRRDDGSFVYVENGHEQPIEAMSGGQRSIAGVGLRLALEASFYGNGGFVILDEPSAELNDMYAASMAGLLAGQDRQIIMITHRDAEEYSANHVISLEA